MKRKTVPLDADLAWNLIARMGWNERGDYEAIAKKFFAELKATGMTRLEAFVDDRAQDLANAVYRYEKQSGTDLEVGSDDGFSDVRYHIVGLGKAAFEKALANPLEIQAQYRSGAYKESFAYCFQEPDPPRTEEQKQRSRELLIKNVADLEKQLREIEFELSNARGLFQDINMLLGQVMEDTKKSA